MAFPFLKYFYLFLLFFSACQPLQYSQLSELESGSEFFNSRTLQEEFKDVFLSEKLDLVFVMDTGQGMEAFYQNSILGPDFLNRLQVYDWQLVWTDMSVDIKKIRGQGKKTQREEEEKCHLLKGLILFPLGLITGAVNMAGWGFDSLGDCVVSVLNIFDGGGSSKTSYANGAFLPFEHKGSKIKNQGGVPSLSPAVENYDSIFDHSFRLKNSGEKTGPYDAPEQKELDSYPFTAMALSMIRGRSPLKPHEDSSAPGKAFFRDDSLIVYVLFTVHDAQVSIEPKSLNRSLKSFFGSEKRVKLIPVTVPDDTSLFCGLKFQNMSGHSPRLKELARQLGNRPLNICSPNLAGELFKEISKSLYPKDLFPPE